MTTVAPDVASNGLGCGPDEDVLTVRDMQVTFGTDEGPLRVIDGVSFSIGAGQTLALVGESGSGKSVSSLAVMGLLRFVNAKVAAETLTLKDRDGRAVDMLTASAGRMREIRGNEMAMIFQEPMSSLNPSHTVGAQITEVLKTHRGMSGREARAAAIRILEQVGIPDPAGRFSAYPHEMSGGMRQRVMIAIALACNPRLIVADEPTTALDVTIQAQILDELRRLQDQYGMALLFITHDLGVVAEIAHKVAVMYCGQVVEEGTVEDVLNRPLHPYTHGLLKSVPRPDQDRDGPLFAIPGRVPDLRNLPSGCRFHPRCEFAQAGRCDVVVPSLDECADQRKVRCVRWDELDLSL